MLYDKLVKIVSDLKAIAYFCEKSNDCPEEDLNLHRSLGLKISDLRTKVSCLSEQIWAKY